MATGVAIAGLIQGQRAAGAARRATAKSEEAQRLTTGEEIRRKKYAHKRDIASIEAEMAGMGIADPKLRKTGEELTRYDAEIAALEKTVTQKKAGATKYTGGSMPNIADTDWVYQLGRPRQLSKEETKLAELKEKQAGEQAMPWSGEGGIFAQYLSEKERVHTEEISWMERTGLSQIAGIRAEGRVAQMRAQGQMISSFGRLGRAAGWWKT